MTTEYVEGSRFSEVLQFLCVRVFNSDLEDDGESMKVWSSVFE